MLATVGGCGVRDGEQNLRRREDLGQRDGAVA